MRIDRSFLGQIVITRTNCAMFVVAALVAAEGMAFAQDKALIERGMKPPMRAYPNLSKEDLDAVVAYMASLKK